VGIEAQLLSVIAAATVVIAVVQIGFFAYGVRVAGIDQAPGRFGRPPRQLRVDEVAQPPKTQADGS